MKLDGPALHRHDYIVQTVTVKIPDCQVHGFVLVHGADAMLLPLRVGGLRVFEPQDTATRSGAVARHDVQIAVAIHVMRLQGHDPACRIKRMPLPGGGFTGLRR